MSTKLIITIAAICCLVFSLVCSVVTYKITNGNWQTKYDNHLLEDDSKRFAYLKNIRDLETNLIKEQEKSNANAKLLQDKYDNDLRDSNAVANELREQIARLSAGGNSTGTTVDRSSATAATDSLVYLRLFERANRAATDLAGYAQKAADAGLTCTNEYNALYNTLNKQ